jgi:hypothetical protein
MNPDGYFSQREFFAYCTWAAIAATLLGPVLILLLWGTVERWWWLLRRRRRG